MKLNLRNVIAVCLVTAALLAALSANPPAAANGPQATSISFTITTTMNYPMTTSGPLNVVFNSVQVDTTPPQSYSFGVTAKTSLGQWITLLHWDFGDGSVKDVPYCCQSQVSEVQNHAYPQQASYTVSVVAFDNNGNHGFTTVTVNWVTPVPEYPSYGLPLLLSIFVMVVAVGLTRGKKLHPFSTIR